MIENLNKQSFNPNFFALSLLLQISGISIFVLGIMNLYNGFLVFFLTLSMWSISAFYKGSNSWIISTGLFLSGMVVFLSIEYIDGFLGFFLFLYLIILAGANYVNNKQEFSNEVLKETIELGKKVCIECGDKMAYNEIFCGNCGNKNIK